MLGVLRCILICFICVVLFFVFFVRFLTLFLVFSAVFSTMAAHVFARMASTSRSAAFRAACEERVGPDLVPFLEASNGETKLIDFLERETAGEIVALQRLAGFDVGAAVKSSIVSRLAHPPTEGALSFVGRCDRFLRVVKMVQLNVPSPAVAAQAVIPGPDNNNGRIQRSTYIGLIVCIVLIVICPVFAFDLSPIYCNAGCVMDGGCGSRRCFCDATTECKEASAELYYTLPTVLLWLGSLCTFVYYCTRWCDQGAQVIRPANPAADEEPQTA